jgi:sec-independent protein translocase protein TatB
MFNIGTGEIALIAVAALIILGPQRLPELARGIGKFMREFRRQTDEVRTVVEREFYKLDQDVSIKGAPDVPDVVAANSVPRIAAGSTKPHDLPLPPGDDLRSQLTQGAPPTVPVSPAPVSPAPAPAPVAAPEPAADPSGTAKS